MVISTTLPTETVAQLQNVISTGGRNPMNSLDGRIEHGISPRKRGNYSTPPFLHSSTTQLFQWASYSTVHIKIKIEPERILIKVQDCILSKRHKVDNLQS